KVSDSATLANAVAPTGHLVFKLYGPNIPSCAGTPVYTNTVTLSGAGPWRSGLFTPTAVGTYRWQASYSGDANNAAATGICGHATEIVHVRPVPAPTHTATPTHSVTPTHQPSPSPTTSAGVGGLASTGPGHSASLTNLAAVLLAAGAAVLALVR